MKNTIRNYYNTVKVEFSQRGENFTLDVPHKRKWLSVLAFLRRRGWKISENAHFKKNYAPLSKYHKIGYKANVVLLAEIGADFIEVQFGNIKNLWHDMPQSFWSNPRDERYAKLTYLETKAVELEIYKFKQFCDKWGLKKIVEDRSLSPTEFIIHKCQVNKHLHGDVKCLEDIKNHITEETYDWRHNSNDRDKKKIVCGDVKYFYDYNRRLCCGVVWHNINNMWWVISGNELKNIASFELFDYTPDLPRRKKATDREVSRILGAYEKKRDYARCLAIQKHHQLILDTVA